MSFVGKDPTGAATFICDLCGEHFRYERDDQTEAFVQTNVAADLFSPDELHSFRRAYFTQPSGPDALAYMIPRCLMLERARATREKCVNCQRRLIKDRQISIEYLPPLRVN